MANGSGKAITEDAVQAAEPGKFLWDGGGEGVNGLGLRVAPGGAKTWLFRYRNGAGQQRYLKLDRYPALNVAGARKRAKVEAGRVAGGADVQAEKEAAKDARRIAPKVADLAAHLEGEYARKRRLRASTLAMYKTAIHAHILPALGKLEVAAVTKRHIEKLHGDVRTAGEAKGAKGLYQANRTLSVLRKMFTVAVEDLEWRALTPCRGVKPYDDEEQRRRNLDEDEVARLLDACAAYPNSIPERGKKEPADKFAARVAVATEASAAIRLLFLTGARLREVLKAEWVQFDLERGWWAKPSAHTKTRREHRLELDGPALELLNAMAERKSDARFLFPGNPALGRKVAVDIAPAAEAAARVGLKRPWAAVCKLAGLEDVRLHDLRRTTASFMLSGGASLATVGKALGHTQASTTARYATLAPSVQREGLRMAGEALVGAKRKSKPGKVVTFLKAAKA